MNRISGVTREKILHWLFEIGIWCKGIDGALEMLGGLLFLATSPQFLDHLIVVLTRRELDADPDDWVANLLRHAGNHLSGEGKWVAGAYLVGHGIIKLFLVIGILRGKLWCYPTAMLVISAFVILQSARMGFHFSFLMLFLTVVDIIIVLLIWNEYRHFKRVH